MSLEQFPGVLEKIKLEGQKADQGEQGWKLRVGLNYIAVGRNLGVMDNSVSWGGGGGGY